MDKTLFFDALLKKGTVPPRYTANGAGPSASAPDDDSAPPPYHLEQVRLPVGGKVPKDSFVAVTELKTHLGLLRAFRELKDRVTDLEANQDMRDKLPSQAQELGPQERWTWFLELALERSVLCDPYACPVFAEPRFVGFIVGFRIYLLFSNRMALFIILPWMCG